MIQNAVARPNVLLMDDDLQCRRFMEVSLRKAGYCVLTAESEVDALEKAFMLKPDAVLTESLGPRVNGVALLEKFRLRQTPRYPVHLCDSPNRSGTSARSDSGEH